MLDQAADFFSFDVIDYQKKNSSYFHVILLTLKPPFMFFSPPKRAYRDKRAGVESVVHGL